MQHTAEWLRSARLTAATGVPVTPTEEYWLQSSEVARMLGIKTQTLAKWRCHGQGPKGGKRFGSNVVLYPRTAVIRYMEEKGLVYDHTN